MCAAGHCKGHLGSRRSADSSTALSHRVLRSRHAFACRSGVNGPGRPLCHSRAESTSPVPHLGTSEVPSYFRASYS